MGRKALPALLAVLGDWPSLVWTLKRRPSLHSRLLVQDRARCAYPKKNEKLLDEERSGTAARTYSVHKSHTLSGPASANAARQHGNRPLFLLALLRRMQTAHVATRGSTRAEPVSHTVIAHL